MRINKLHRFVFVSVPKVCTHSIYHILSHHYQKGLIAKWFHHNVVPLRYSRYFRWTVCRNPFTRAASLWWSACRLARLDQYRFRERCGAADDFTRFVAWLAGTTAEERKVEPLMMSQTQWLQPAQPLRILHLETLANDLEQLPFWKQGIQISQLNTTSEKIAEEERHEGRLIPRPSIASLYSDDTARRAVIDWARPDFDRFGYSLEVSCRRN